MARLDSPHIAKCFDIYQNNDLKIIVMEYCGQGTLYDAVFRKGKISEEEAVGYLKQMIMGLAVKKLLFRKCIKSTSFTET